VGKRTEPIAARARQGPTRRLLISPKGSQSFAKPVTVNPILRPQDAPLQTRRRVRTALEAVNGLDARQHMPGGHPLLPANTRRPHLTVGSWEIVRGAVTSRVHADAHTRDVIQKQGRERARLRMAVSVFFFS
jgi:hypothetical protein